MSAQRTADISPIPSAPFGDLELDRDEDEEEWERRVMQLAADRIQAARTRLEAMGIIDADGKRASSELPLDTLHEPDIRIWTGADPRATDEKAL